ncbi:hypothetical protein FG386_000109 [Cryptosporidium ryanae]|uniref:uncharacterized protein n=1 Tax=Cryptosporidium ryanae TaxID=515981 RepID=UPI00351A8534|nr:hypothetical protein FG386_000109 [Cryptosporidium ryanae]
MENSKDFDSSVQTIQKLQLLQGVLESQKAVSELTSRCFQKCISFSSSTRFPFLRKDKNKLSNKEKKCLWDCTQNYLQCYEFISERYKIIQQDNEGNKQC